MRFFRPSHNRDQQNETEQQDQGQFTLTSAESELVEIAELDADATETSETESDGGPRGQGGRSEGGPRGSRPEPEDLTQESVTNDDGSVDVTMTATNSEGEEHVRKFTIADNDEGGIDISSSREDGGSRTVTISADDDGGVDIDVVCINEEGETSTRHIELDMNDDGTISFEGLFTRDGEEHTVERTLEVERFLGEADEELTVAEVLEAHLERGHVDMDALDLTGLSNLDASTDLLIV